ncbi:MAG: hypothetical protein LQ337_008449 [Flavoplaca oasis]|nr:MAG: hypothetical protein LQ337_008449 [Flavoplaca oasis]
MRRISSLLLLLTLLSRTPAPCEAPTLPVPSVSIIEERWHTAADRLASHWNNPNDVLTILLIIGGDIVQKALAQLSGGQFVPVAFSFGWVSYSFNALLLSFGDGALMPTIIYPSILISVCSGYARPNHSWILNRLLRGVEASLEPLQAAFCVSVFRCKPYDARLHYDWLWWSGVITIIIQLIIASVPFALENDWTFLLAAGTGISLSLTGGALPQWRKEKWGARIDDRSSSFCLTRGNGFQHVVVICNDGRGCLNLEDLAMPRRYGCSQGCKIFITISAMLWILFLINVAGLRHNAWYLLAVGFLGMVQNMSAAAVLRRPETVGMPLELVARISDHKVMQTLMETERRFPSVGAALVNTFFPGEIFEDERRFWTSRRKVPKCDRERIESVDQPNEECTAKAITRSNTHGRVPCSQIPTNVTMDPFMSQLPYLPSRRLTT